MQSFNILKEIEVKENFKNNQIKSVFDIQENKITHKATHNLFFDEMPNWNIGVITGLSGAGKSTLAKEIAKQYNIKVIEKNEWNNDSIINNFKGNIDEVLDFLTKVGLNTQPSYLKPYNILSNGEKMRCDVAKAIFENDFVIIDEFTSVVDRHIAKIICMCIKKLLNKYSNKKIIFVSCHKDFLEWLEPSWHYDLDTQTFTKDIPWQRPKMEFYITKGQKADWELFRQYHYLNHNLASNTTNIFLLLNENQDKVGFIAFRVFPHPRIALEKIHRLVILPDYQGIGLGNSFLSKTCALHFKEKNKTISITTSLLRFANSIKKNKDFICFHCGPSGKNKGKSSLNKRKRLKLISFKYLPSVKAEK